MEVRPDEADVHVRCVRRVVCGLCAELLGGRGAWRVTLFIVHPHWWAAGSRAGRRDFAPWDVPHTGELFQGAYICHGYYPRAFLVRTQLHRPSGILCSAAGWLAFGIPSACALTCVRLVPECVWSPNLAPRARLLALYPGCGLREPSGGCGPAGSGRAGFWRIVWRRASRLCLAICWRRRRRSGACWGRGGGGRRKAPVLRIKESAKKNAPSTEAMITYFR